MALAAVHAAGHISYLKCFKSKIHFVILVLLVRLTSPHALHKVMNDCQEAKSVRKLSHAYAIKTIVHTFLFSLTGRL